jgi:hypothetical protein
MLFLVLMVASIATAAAPALPDDKPHILTFGGPQNSEFFLDGKPFQMIGGEMHPARILVEYWRHRIRMAKAMGLNTIAIYVFWNFHERAEGKFDFTSGSRNIAEFLRLAREEGVWINLRPGPYCCGEWDLGGIPAYLLRYPDIKLRTLKDDHYAEAVKRYIHALAQIVKPYMAASGRPILLVQIENEYGSYPRRDHDYLVWLRDLWIKEGIQGPFYTADGPDEGYLKGVVVSGVAVGLDTGTNEQHFALARRLNPGVPVFASEVYPGWLRHWGEGNWQPSNVSGLVKYYMDTRKSFNLYMFHGGTNFGFTAGANSGGAGYEPDVTSYDYGSPLDEQGRPTAAYDALRKQLASYLPDGRHLPEIPAAIPTIRVSRIAIRHWTSLWDHLPAAIPAAKPECFEKLGQNQGMMLYRTTITAGGKRRLRMQHVHDWAQVFVDQRLIGTLDRRRGEREIELPTCDGTANLEILVEAMGHINFTIAMDSDRKGLFGEVKLGTDKLENWQMFPLPLGDEWISGVPDTARVAERPGGIFQGELQLDRVADMFLDMSQWKKGVVWVNGQNLGRYWSIGPQQRLYCPGPWLKKGVNKIVILDLELTEPQPLDGKPERN